MADSVKKCFQDSVFLSFYQKGKEGIKNQYREKIRLYNPRTLIGSMDIDEACKDNEPNSPRWDYLVVISKNNQENLALIEIHGAAKPENIKEMKKKKEWLNSWLTKARLVNFKKKLFWISTNGVSITPQSGYGKQLAELGFFGPKRVTPYLDTEVEYL